MYVCVCVCVGLHLLCSVSRDVGGGGGVHRGAICRCTIARDCVTVMIQSGYGRRYGFLGLFLRMSHVGRERGRGAGSRGVFRGRYGEVCITFSAGMEMR